MSIDGRRACCVGRWKKGKGSREGGYLAAGLLALLEALGGLADVEEGLVRRRGAQARRLEALGAEAAGRLAGRRLPKPDHALPVRLLHSAQRKTATLVPPAEPQHA